MQIVYLSNYYNHHQRCLTDALRKRADSFLFLETAQMSEARKKLGYQELERPEDVRRYLPGQDDARILAADLVIYGEAPYTLVKQRIREKKLTFRCSERIFKQKPSLKSFLYRRIDYKRKYPKYTPTYLLAASAYTMLDCAKLGCFRDKAFKWGYFPEVKHYDPALLSARKDKNLLLWCGRFLDWKHPDDALDLAGRLKTAGYRFRLTMIGTGDLERTLQRTISEKQLEDCVELTGSMPPAQVRERMERAGIYLFTSDRQEGWGAVLNESMNSCCAVVASHAIGAVPYLIQNGENGIIYPSGDRDALFEKVRGLLEHPEEQARLGKAAYRTITEDWSPELAAERLLRLAECLRRNEIGNELFSSGVCSPAELLKESWLASRS